jgi:hypothetical protein
MLTYVSDIDEKPMTYALLFPCYFKRFVTYVCLAVLVMQPSNIDEKPYALATAKDRLIDFLQQCFSLYQSVPVLLSKMQYQ